MSNETVLFLVQTSDWCWGKGATLDEAIKVTRSMGSKVTRTSRKVDYIVYEFNDEVKPDTVFIDGMGSCRWETVEPHPESNSHGLVREWIRQEGKERVLVDN